MAAAAGRAAMRRSLEEALAGIQYPDKDQVWRHMQAVGKQHERKFPGYSFVRRGGLSSPYVQYVTDADIIFNNREWGHVSVGDFDVLTKLALDLCRGAILSAKVSCEEKDLYDQDVEDLRVVRSIVSEGADLTVITGMYTLASGWCVPVDLTLQRGEDRMSKALRKVRILANVEEHNFAKAVQRIRALLDDPAKKQAFAREWNAVGGALRFLVKQLGLVRRLPERERRSYLPYLLLPLTTGVEEWAEFVEEEMQRNALDLLMRLRSLVLPALGPEGEGIYAIIEAAARGSPSPGASGSEVPTSS